LNYGMEMEMDHKDMQTSTHAQAEFCKDCNEYHHEDPGDDQDLSEVELEESEEETHYDEDSQEELLED